MEPARTRSLGDRVAAVALVAVITLAGAVVALGVVALTNIDDTSTARADDSSWDTIVVVDALSGDLTVHDASGEQIDRIRTGIEFPEITQMSPSHLVVVGQRGDRFAIDLVDIRTGDVDDLLREIPRDDSRRLRAVRVAGVDVVAIGDDTAPGTVYLANTDGDVVDIADEARWNDPFIPLFGIQANGDRTVVAVPDASREPTTALVTLSDLDVEVVDGQLATTSDDEIITRTRDDDRTEETVRIFRSDGTEADRFDVDRFITATTGDDASVIALGADGDVVRLTPDGSETLAQAGPSTEGDPPRFAVNRGANPLLGVIDETGRPVIVTADGRVLDDFDLDAPVERLNPGARCLSVFTETTIAVLDTDTGRVVAEGRRGGERFTSVAATSVDGCTVVTLGEEFLLLGPERDVRFDSGETVVGLSPDGTTYGVRTDIESVEIESVDRSVDPIEIETGAFRVFFLQR